LIKALRKNGLLVVGASENVIRLLPPLNIKKTEIIEAVKILKKNLYRFRFDKEINDKKN